MQFWSSGPLTLIPNGIIIIIKPAAIFDSCGLDSREVGQNLIPISLKPVHVINTESKISN